MKLLNTKSSALIKPIGILIILSAIVAAYFYIKYQFRDTCPPGPFTSGASVYVIRGSIVCKLIDINPYATDNPGHMWSKYIVLSDRDASTFQVVTGPGEHPLIYTKDKNGVYFEDKKVVGADPNTFTSSLDMNFATVTPSVYWKDKNHGYFIAYGKNTIISDSPESFKNLGNFYASDIDNVYLEGLKINGADPATFQVLDDAPDCHTNTLYAKDKRNVYYNGNNIVQGADSKSFVFLGYGFAKDDAHIYKDGVASTTLLSAVQSELHCWYYNDKIGG